MFNNNKAVTIIKPRFVPTLPHSTQGAVMCALALAPLCEQKTHNLEKCEGFCIRLISEVFLFLSFNLLTYLYTVKL